jgi:amidase
MLLSVMAGPDPRVPYSLSDPGAVFLQPLTRDFKACRVAWTPDLGRYPAQPQVVEVCEAALGDFEMLGCQVEHSEPDMSGADEVFQILRAWNFAAAHGDDLRSHRDRIKDTLIWNVEQGLRLSAEQVAKAEAERVDICMRMQDFMQEYEFLLLPVSQVLPFPVDVEWVQEIDGQRMETYIDWMATCYAITLTGLPCISVPCGFSAEGLPVGMQIVGGFRRDFEVLQLAYAFERATGHARQHPPIEHSAEHGKWTLGPYPGGRIPGTSRGGSPGGKRN